MEDKKSAIQILRTKLNRPPVAPDIYPRDRLLKMIDESRQLPVCLISAPSGYGKSTLASRWLADCNCSNAWLSLDAQDNDPRLFLAYFLSAIQSACPMVGQGARALLQTDQQFPTLGSQDKGIKKNADGSMDIYFAPKAPKGKEVNWLQTIPGKSWFVALRFTVLW